MTVCKNIEMTGVVAELHRRATDGRTLESGLVFRPECEWYMPKDHDNLAEIAFTDVEGFIKDFGVDVLERVSKGEIVKVKLKVERDYEFRGCPHKGRVWHRTEHNVQYPIKGKQEDISRF